MMRSMAKMVKKMIQNSCNKITCENCEELRRGCSQFSKQPKTFTYPGKIIQSNKQKELNTKWQQYVL
jgi:hypothetical protein